MLVCHQSWFYGLELILILRTLDAAEIPSGAVVGPKASETLPDALKLECTLWVKERLQVVALGATQETKKGTHSIEGNPCLHISFS